MRRMLVQIIMITCIQMVTSIELSSGQPIPHADELRKILAANDLNYTNPEERSLLDFLFNPSATTQDTKANDSSSEYMVNLDIDVLDANNLKKIVTNARKWNREHRAMKYTWYDKYEARTQNPFFEEMALRQMKQSIYATRYRIMSTAPIRKRFIDVEVYQIAILVATLNHIMVKSENLYAQMLAFPDRTHFIWYLIIYEKILSGHVEVGYMTKKIYELNAKIAAKYK